MSAETPPITPPLRATRPFHWSVRREIWENRSIYLAPLAIAALVVFALAVGLHTMPRKLAAAAGDPAQHFDIAVRPFRIAPAPIMAMTFLVGMFYALDALYGERRDRSILF
jgi:ABC-2 type transport system permease protein